MSVALSAPMFTAVTSRGGSTSETTTTTTTRSFTDNQTAERISKRRASLRPGEPTGGELRAGGVAPARFLRGVNSDGVAGSRNQGAHLERRRVPRNVLHHVGHCEVRARPHVTLVARQSHTHTHTLGMFYHLMFCTNAASLPAYIWSEILKCNRSNKDTPESAL